MGTRHVDRITSDQVMKMREVSGMGMQESKKVLMGRALRRDLMEARKFNDLLAIVSVLVDKTYPQDHFTTRALEAYDEAARDG